ncbi:hypothetical protein GCM10022278_31810 [Allohahella marinimesophila]|uniref:Uncharacterized protein n=1 Tax=Allohahella marinimesophila TaxID=1054972 RepID=A0ABP7PVN6_9GAMM
MRRVAPEELRAYKPHFSGSAVTFERDSPYKEAPTHDLIYAFLALELGTLHIVPSRGYGAFDTDARRRR